MTARGYVHHRADQARRQRIYETVGESIRRIRTGQDMTQTQLAKLVGISPQTLMHYEQGQAQPLHVIYDIAHELDCSIDELVEVLTDDPEEP